MSSEPNIFEIAQKTRYPVDAFIFIQRGLDHTVRNIHGQTPEAQTQAPTQASPGTPKDEESLSRHISGQQLCEGLRKFAVQQYGLMARTVLRRFKIYHTEDFGHLVFAMVNAGLMRKTDEDTLADFTAVYDFSEAFGTELQLSQ
ncbi:MAG: hypothetical protein JKX85_08340 [Phycisphaeraceae bacterium]|nr:hypothetical protein [Phycisphaeraceae bacterium]